MRDDASAAVPEPLRRLTHGVAQGAGSGPLCGEPMRAVAFTVTTCNVDRRVVATRAAQAAAVAGRELTHKMLLASAPRLMEPVMAVDLWTLPFAVEEARELLLKRRAWAIQEAHAPGTPLRLVSALMPLADAFGFETQLRVATRGAAYASLRPDHWALVPGDPLDASANLPPGEVAVGVAIAHDFMAKTRRRKGLADEVDRK
jgi:U5 small nuclear ribonucleoprotein component